MAKKSTTKKSSAARKLALKAKKAPKQARPAARVMAALSAAQPV